jgi:pyochelin biosynthetic protein PchC
MGLPTVEVYAACYPGRAERIGEPPPPDLRRLAEEIAGQVARLADRPLALFGHSMGAVLALEIARSLEAKGAGLSHVFASGSRDGECVAAEPDALVEDPDAVMADLVRLGGTDPELAADPDFRELVLPYLLGDGRMYHRYVMAERPVLRCPVTSIVGDADLEADRRPWRRLTSGGYQEHTLPGDHFYLVREPPYGLVQRVLGERWDGTVGQRTESAS